jgi:DNA helicase-2/ATP-dependent DNA helicase PcrA
VTARAVLRRPADPVELAELLGWERPTDEQLAVIGAPLEPLAVVAGAGSGKTATIAARVVWLVASGQLPPEQVLGLTFTRKAAGELAARLRRRIGQWRAVAGDPGGSETGGEDSTLRRAETGGEECTVSTYHGYAARLFAEHAARDGLEPTVRLASPAVCWQLASRVVEDYAGPMDAVVWQPATVVAAVLALADELGDHLREPADLARFAAGLRRDGEDVEDSAALRELLRVSRARDQLLPLVAAYTAEKRRRGWIDHADQVALTARLATRHGAVGAAERQRYRVVLLDEYQDTGHAQRVLLQALFGGGHPVTAVGDPCQSIYGWRGAGAGGLGRFPADFPGGDGRPAAVRHLATSFRNPPVVLAAANRLAEPLRAVGVDVPRLRAAEDRAGVVRCSWHETADDEARWLAGEIAGLVVDGVPPGEVAVLVRRRSQFPRLRAALLDRGLPVEVFGLGGLLYTPEVADVVATLRVLADPSADAALLRLLVGPRWLLGPRDLAALGRRARALTAAGRDPAGRGPAEAGWDGAGTPDPLAVTPAGAGAGPAAGLVEALDDPGEPGAYSRPGWRRLLHIRDELRGLRARLDAPLPELVTAIVRTLRLDVELAATPGVDPAEARADLDAFLEVAARFAGDAETPTPGAFLGYLLAAEEQEFGLQPGRQQDGAAAGAGPGGGSAAVALLTVHAAKGLEFPVVAVPGLRDPGFPSPAKVSTSWIRNARLLPFPLRGDAADLPVLGGLDRAAIDRCNAQVGDRELLEERRLAYVAATRAGRALLASGYCWGDGKRPGAPSPFLEDIRAAGAEVACWAAQPAGGAENPLLAAAAAVPWPARPAGPRARAVAEAAGWVAAAEGATEAGEPSAVRGFGAADRVRLADWQRAADLLLAERAALQERRRTGPTLELTAGGPGELSVSELLLGREDPAELTRRLRRPLPRRPVPAAHRGSAFHVWVESVLRAPALIDVDDLPGGLGVDGEPPGGGDRPVGDGDEAELAELRRAFRASRWWGRQPETIEVPFSTRLGDVTLRGRIDAVYREPDGGFLVVDWKTGLDPAGDQPDEAVTWQLAAYRLAWARLAGCPVGEVAAAAHYVRSGRTLRPHRLPDPDELAAAVSAVPVLPPADPPPAPRVVRR